jgi:hypothetical protein
VAAAQAVKRDQIVFYDTCDVRADHDARIVADPPTASRRAASGGKREYALHRDVLPGTMIEHRVWGLFRMIQMRDTPYQH